MQLIDYFNLAFAVLNLAWAARKRNLHSFTGWLCYLICYAKFAC